MLPHSITFIVRVYCRRGARLSAFFTNGLRYRDVELVLQRTPVGRWRLIYRIDQRWVKNIVPVSPTLPEPVHQEGPKPAWDSQDFPALTFGFSTLAMLENVAIDHLTQPWVAATFPARYSSCLPSLTPTLLLPSGQMSLSCLHSVFWLARPLSSHHLCSRQNELFSTFHILLVDWKHFGSVVECA